MREPSSIGTSSFSQLPEITLFKHTPTWQARWRAAFLQFALLAGLLAAAPILAADSKKDADKDSYDQDSILKDAADFFGQSTEGLAKVIEKAFKDHGRPNGYIKGQEASGAIAVLTDGGVADTVPPGRPVLSAVQVTLVRSPCDGRGMACPEMDSFTMTVTASDDRTPAERLRYVAFFGATAAEASSAPAPELLFEHEPMKISPVSSGRSAGGVEVMPQRISRTLGGPLWITSSP